MWDIRRTVPVERWPRARTVVAFRFDDVPARASGVVAGRQPTARWTCATTTPGFEVDRHRAHQPAHADRGLARRPVLGPGRRSGQRSWWTDRPRCGAPCPAGWGRATSPRCRGWPTRSVDCVGTSAATSVAFFRNLNLGQRRSRSPTRPELLEAFEQAGATSAVSFQTNGTVIFTAGRRSPQRLADRAVELLTPVCGYDDMVAVRSADWLNELDLDDVPAHAEVSFFDSPDPFPEPLPWERPLRGSSSSGGQPACRVGQRPRRQQRCDLGARGPVGSEGHLARRTDHAALAPRSSRARARTDPLRWSKGLIQARSTSQQLASPLVVLVALVGQHADDLASHVGVPDGEGALPVLDDPHVIEAVAPRGVFRVCSPISLQKPGASDHLSGSPVPSSPCVAALPPASRPWSSRHPSAPPSAHDRPRVVSQCHVTRRPHVWVTGPQPSSTTR